MLASSALAGAEIKSSLPGTAISLSWVSAPEELRAPAAPAAARAPSSGSCSASPAKDCGCDSAKVSICRVHDHGLVESTCADADKIGPTGCLPAIYRPDAAGDGDGSDPGIWTCDAPRGCIADGRDCNDRDPNINPGMTEVCNLVDDNCNGQVDEGLGTSVCGRGVRQHTVQNCVNGAPEACDPFQGQSPEIRDNLDNDCDGCVDGVRVFPAMAQGAVPHSPTWTTWTAR